MSDPADNFLDRVIGRSQAASAKLSVKSALNPMLWLCGIVTTPCIALAWFSHGTEPFSTILTVVGALPVVVACGLATYFGIFKPDKLQSEDYQIRHETLELIKQKGSPIEISPSSLELVANPLHRAVEHDNK